MGMMRPLDVSLAGGASAQLGYNTFILVEGPPGQIDIACKIGDKTASGQVQIQGGETRFVEVSMNAGLWTPNCEIAEVSAGQGEAGVRSARRVEPL
jgi:formylmethanofuran dehydrogenase subunit C